MVISHTERSTVSADPNNRNEGGIRGLRLVGLSAFDQLVP